MFYWRLESAKTPMAEEAKRPDTSRRTFLKATAIGGTTALLPGVGRSDARAPAPEAVPASPTTGLFDAAERSALASLADLVLPGAAGWGAVDYIEGVLTIFEHDPPRLYAGPVGAGDAWLPLDRVRQRAWRLRIYGSDAVENPNEAVLGPVTGLQPLIARGAREAAQRRAGGESPEWVWWRLPGAFRDAFTELVLEGTLGDPIYGGNRDGAAWRAFHFEGAMLGYGTYSPSPHEHPAERAGSEGPDPLGPFTRAALWAMGFFSRWIA